MIAAKTLLCFSPAACERARAEDVALGVSKAKREIMSRGSRTGRLFLLLGVLRDWETGIRTVLPCSSKGLGALELS